MFAFINNKNTTTFILFGIILLFAISKIPYLNLPYYWDEAWSYAVAVLDLHDHGVSLLPGSVNTEFTRGHPLLYYACAGLWMKIFGTSLFAAHIFALIVSCCAIYAEYLLAKNLFNKTVAIASVLLFSVQSWFWVQSTMLLPEVFLMLFTILAINAYFIQKWRWFILWTSCVVLTKETGWVLLIVFFFDHFILSFIFNKKQFNREYWKKSIFLCIPLTAIILFLAIQKIRLSWFFFPGHIGLMHFSATEILNSITFLLIKFFLDDLRIIYLVIIAVGLLSIKRKPSFLSKHQTQFASFIICFWGAFLLFSSINFFTVRYLLSILPLFIILVLAITHQATSNKTLNTISILFLCCILLINSNFINLSTIILMLAIVSIIFAIQCRFQTLKLQYFSIVILLCTIHGQFLTTQKQESDIAIGFKSSVQVHQRAIHFCESQQWYNQPLQTGFLQWYNTTIPRLGYLKDSTRIFTNLTDKSPTVYLFYSCAYNPPNLIDSLKKDSTFSFQRFEDDQAWAEVYYKKNLYK